MLGKTVQQNIEKLNLYYHEGSFSNEIFYNDIQLTSELYNSYCHTAIETGIFYIDLVFYSPYNEHTSLFS